MPSDDDLHAVTPALLREWPLPTESDSKHGRGHVVVVGGAGRTPGAALLAGLAALRVGAGVLAFGVARPVASAVAVAVPESAVYALAADEKGSVLGTDLDSVAALADADAVLMGCGLDDPDGARALLDALPGLIPTTTPVVLDAYALGVLPNARKARDALAGRLVLTPNTSELAFLLERDDPGESTAAAAEVARRYDAVVSAQSRILSPTAGWHITTGDAGLGTSGSGDVLAGALVGLLARGLPTDRAACWATHLHAAAGDRLTARISRTGFLARELLDELPRVIAELQG